MDVKVKIKRLDSAAILPEYKTREAAAMDLYSTEDVTLYPSTRAMVGTGIAIALPEGYEAQIRARSGVASKGIIVLNGPGTIDSDYRGEIKILLANIGTLSPDQYEANLQFAHACYEPLTFSEPLYKNETFKIKKGDRIAQMLIAPVWRADFEEVDELDETERGSGAFGSTGKN